MRRLLAVFSLLPMLLAVPPAAAGPALLFDPEDGKILYAEDFDSQWHPASLTKIMTAYLAFEAIKSGRITLDTKISCSKQATLVQPSKLGLPVGAEITVEVALQALIIKSANDVAIMLAEAIAGSEPAFVNMMNVTARRLGMTRSSFANANGLPSPNQVSTARDLAKLGRAVMRDHPEYASWWALSELQVGKTKLTSHNSLLKTFEGADGLKTGFICDSGFNVVASATRDGKRLMAVVLGEPTAEERSIRAGSLLEHGFQRLGWKQLFNANTIDNLPISPDAKSAVSVRTSVLAWACGYRPPQPQVASTDPNAKPKAAKGRKKTNAGEARQGAGRKTSQKKPQVAGAATPATGEGASKKPKSSGSKSAKPKAEAAPAAPATAPVPAAAPAPVIQQPASQTAPAASP